MQYKKLIPCFGCKDGMAVMSDSSRNTVTEDILALSQYYSDNGADEILIRDLSDSDDGHEQTIGIIKTIARKVDVPLIVGGRVKRLEDVKKYLYAGARAVFLNVSDEDNLDMIKEASDRFGSEKIYAYLPEAGYISRIEEYAQLGASVMILDTSDITREFLMQLDELAAESANVNVADASGADTVSDTHPEHTASLITCFVICSGEEEETARWLCHPLIGGAILNLPSDSPRDCMARKQALKARQIPVDTFESAIPWSSFKLNSNGLIPVIVQDYKTDQVLMMAYMNEEAYEATLHSGRMTYFSRSRQSLWLKGETSGHFQYVKSLSLDCDNDTILAKVRQVGAACHTGSRSCFFQPLARKEYADTNPLKVFEDVFHVILDRKENPKEGSYTNYLFDKGIDKILKKVGEEATEIIIAAKNPDPEEIKYEISDFLYHVMVLMAEKGVTWEEITEELANR